MSTILQTAKTPCRAKTVLNNQCNFKLSGNNIHKKVTLCQWLSWHPPNTWWCLSVLSRTQELHKTGNASVLEIIWKRERFCCLGFHAKRNLMTDLNRTSLMSHQPQAGHQPQNDNILIMHLNAMLTLDQPLLYISKGWNLFLEDFSYSDYLGPFHLYNSFVASPEEEQIVVVVFSRKRDTCSKVYFSRGSIAPHLPHPITG